MLPTTELIDAIEGVSSDAAVGLLTAALGALATLLVAAWTFAATQAAARRERRAAVYAEALRAVSDYNEGPYRVRRRDGSAEQRAAITAVLSDVKSRIDFHQSLLQLHAPTKVAQAYDTLVDCARAEAGTQMREAWTKPPASTDADVNLDVPYPRPSTEAARARAVMAMQASLAVRCWKPWTWVQWWRT